MHGRSRHTRANELAPTPRLLQQAHQVTVVDGETQVRIFKPLESFRDHGRVRLSIEENLSQAQAALTILEEAGEVLYRTGVRFGILLPREGEIS